MTMFRAVDQWFCAAAYAFCERFPSVPLPKFVIEAALAVRRHKRGDP